MSDFRHVHRIEVTLWGRHVGTIVPVPGRRAYAFKFDPSFVKSGIEIAPLMMPLRKDPYFFPDLPYAEYSGLPPVFSDSLPDGFGRGLIERYLMEKGLDRREITPLDQLAYVGKRAIGALSYEPDRSPSGRPTILDMRELVEEARMAVSDELASCSVIERYGAFPDVGGSWISPVRTVYGHRRCGVTCVVGTGRSVSQNRFQCSLRRMRRPYAELFVCFEGRGGMESFSRV